MAVNSLITQLNGIAVYAKALETQAHIVHFNLRAARRPKPLSLKQQALADLDTIETHDRAGYQIADLSNIRRALEHLDD